MRYRKPEVSILGDAARAIQFTGMKDNTDVQLDTWTGSHYFNPAYDLDE